MSLYRLTSSMIVDTAGKHLDFNQILRDVYAAAAEVVKRSGGEVLENSTARRFNLTKEEAIALSERKVHYFSEAPPTRGPFAHRHEYRQVKAWGICGAPAGGRFHTLEREKVTCKTCLSLLESTP